MTSKAALLARAIPRPKRRTLTQVGLHCSGVLQQSRVTLKAPTDANANKSFQPGGGNAAALEIFRPGKWQATDGSLHTFSTAQVEAIAKAYDPALSAAPLVVGHPKLDDPAYGWAKSLVFKDGKLVAAPEKVDPAFAQLVKDGRFGKISSSFYAPDAPNNPKPGGYYLRHIGFLGATAPAVPGLKSANFAADETGIVSFGDDDYVEDRVNAGLWRSLRDWIIGKFGQDEADKVIDQYSIQTLEQSAAEDAVTAQQEDIETAEPSPGFAEPNTPKRDAKKGSSGGVVPATPKSTGHSQQEEARMSVDFAAKEEDLKKQQEALAEREKKIADAEKATKRKELVAFAETLAGDGKILPRHKAGLVEFMAAIEQSAELSFAEGDAVVKKTPRQWFEAFVKELPKQIDFGEHGGGADPQDDPAAVAAAAQTYQAEQAKLGKQVRTSDAVRHVMGR